MDALGGSVTRNFEIWNYGGVALDLTGTPLVKISGYDDDDFNV